MLISRPIKIVAKNVAIQTALGAFYGVLNEYSVKECVKIFAIAALVDNLARIILNRVFKASHPLAKKRIMLSWSIIVQETTVLVLKQKDLLTPLFRKIAILYQALCLGIILTSLSSRCVQRFPKLYT